MNRRRSLIVALALLIFCGVPANGKDTWTKVQSKNFTLVGNANEREMRLIFSLQGETALALDHLRWVAVNGNKNFVEYPLAFAEIARLEHATAAAKLLFQNRAR